MTKLSSETVLEIARSDFGPTPNHQRQLRQKIRARAAKEAPRSFLRAHAFRIAGVGVLAVAAFGALTFASEPPREAPRAGPPVAMPVASVETKVEAPTLSPDRLPDAPPVETARRAPPAARSAYAAAPAAPAPSPSAEPTSIAPHEAPSAPTRIEDSLGAEMRILREAHAALKRGDLAGTHRSLDEHARSYPRGVLRDERLAIAALVLCAEGRHGEARRSAEELARESPRSSHLQRLRGSCVADTLTRSND